MAPRVPSAGLRGSPSCTSRWATLNLEALGRVSPCSQCSAWPALALAGIATLRMTRAALRSRPRAGRTQRASQTGTMDAGRRFVPPSKGPLVHVIKKRRPIVLNEEAKEAIDTYRLSPSDPVVPEELGDTLIPQQPIGRVVTKGYSQCLEYDAEDGPEFVADAFGTGYFSWDPVSPEGFALKPGEYAEEAVPVPADRIQYLQGGGFLESEEDEDYRAYIDEDVFFSHGRKWKRIILKGHRLGVRSGMLRLMAGVFRRRPWEVDADVKPLA